MQGDHNINTIKPGAKSPATPTRQSITFTKVRQRSPMKDVNKDTTTSSPCRKKPCAVASHIGKMASATCQYSAIKSSHDTIMGAYKPPPPPAPRRKDNYCSCKQKKCRDIVKKAEQAGFGNLIISYSKKSKEPLPAEVYKAVLAEFKSRYGEKSTGNIKGMRIASYHYKDTVRHIAKHSSRSYGKNLVSTNELGKYGLAEVDVKHCTDKFCTDNKLGGKKSIVLPTNELDDVEREFDYYIELANQHKDQKPQIMDTIIGNVSMSELSLPTFAQKRKVDAIRNLPAPLKLGAIPSALGEHYRVEGDPVNYEKETLKAGIARFRQSEQVKDKREEGYNEWNAKTKRAGTIPLVYRSREKDRCTGDLAGTKHEQASRSELDIGTRLEIVATGSYNTLITERKTLQMPVKAEDKLNALVPFTQMNSTYKFIPIEDEEDMELSWNRVTTYRSTQFTKSLSEKNGQSVLYVDHDNLLGYGVNYAFFRLGDYMDIDDVPFQRYVALDKIIGPTHSAPIGIMMCSYLHDCCTIASNEEELDQQAFLEQMEQDDDEAAQYTIKMLPFLKSFLEWLMHLAVEELILRKFPINHLTRLNWLPWNMLATNFRPILSPELQEVMDNAVNQIEERVYRDNPQATDEDVHKAMSKAKEFHGLSIMAISQQTKDENVWRSYRRLFHGYSDALSLLEDLALIPFDKMHDLQVEILRKDSLSETKSHSIMNIIAISYLFADGGIPEDPVHVKALPDVGDKKGRIAYNCKIQYGDRTKKYYGFGVDTHVERLLSIIAEVLFPSCDKATISRMVHLAAKSLGPEVGIYANEIIGQFGQFINQSNKNNEIRELKEAVFNRLAALDKSFLDIIQSWDKHFRCNR